MLNSNKFNPYFSDKLETVTAFIVGKHFQLEVLQKFQLSF